MRVSIPVLTNRSSAVATLAAFALIFAQPGFAAGAAGRGGGGAAGGVGGAAGGAATRAAGGGVGGVQGGIGGAAGGNGGAAHGGFGSAGEPGIGGGRRSGRLLIPGGNRRGPTGFGDGERHFRESGSGYGRVGGYFGQGAYLPGNSARCLVRVDGPYGPRIRRVC